MYELFWTFTANVYKSFEISRMGGGVAESLESFSLPKNSSIDSRIMGDKSSRDR